jgi:hypothetical protein
LNEVGDDVVVSVAEGKYEPTVRFTLPAEGTTRAEVPIDATPSQGRLTARLADVADSGVYQAQLQPLQGDVENRVYAVNVAPGEGDLAIEPVAELARQLAGIDFELHDAADMALNAETLAGFGMSDALLGVLIVTLVCEQLFAYMASFHATPLRGGAR